jgi:DNA (cytosine-5)-methyltransferase 1
MILKAKKPTVISLFSGCGGMDYGFVKAGMEIVWANDNFLDAVATYKNNIGHEINSEDIEKVDIDAIPNADIVIGGFPCQGFSIANMKRTVGDERNILYTYFVKIVQQKKPKIFIAENVKGY